MTTKNNPALTSYREGPITAEEAAAADLRAQEIADLLNIPREKVKETLSGNPDLWFPEGSDTGAASAYRAQRPGGEEFPMGPVADILADPLNFVGGAAAKGAKTVPGMVASVSNYIPSWYGPGKPINPDSMFNPAVQAAYQKAAGAAGWVADSVKSGVQHALDPVSRAKFVEQNVTTPAQKRVGKLMDDPARGKDKAVSQIQYTSGHIPRQTDSVSPNANPAAAEVLERSFIESYQPLEKGAVSEALQRHPVKEYTGPKTKPTDKEFAASPERYVSKEDADIVDEWVGLNMGDSRDFVIKAPTAQETGGHFNDVVYKNPAKKAMQDGFVKHMDADGNVDLPALYEFLQENQGHYNDLLRKAGRQKKNGKGDSLHVGRITDSGIFIKGGKIGSAITEGGVSYLTKIEKDGTMTTWMADVHDFGEKLPGMSMVIPNTVVAITPPMVSNIKNLTKNNAGLTATLKDPSGKAIKEGRKHVKKTHPAGKQYKQTPRRGSKGPYKSLFEGYLDVSPTTKGVALETRRLAGEGLLAQRLNENLQRED